MSEKKIKGFQWQAEEVMDFKLTGLQVNFITQLTEYAKGLELISQTLMKTMIDAGKAVPIYEEDSVEDILQKNPPKDDNTQEAVPESETNKTETSTTTESTKPIMEVVK